LTVENTFRELCLSSFGGVLLVLDFRAERGESFSSLASWEHANLISFEFSQGSTA
jgi:hypothetical protein